MLKHIVFAISGYLISLSSFAQSNEIDQVLREIEQNNKELKAFQSLIESRKFEMKSGNNLPDLQISGFYLPFGEHSSSDYSEFQVSQSFEFPTVYAVRKDLINKQAEQLKLEYEQLRLEILMPVKKYCLELISLAKLLEIEQNRITQARQVYEQVQELFQKEQVGILELNKAKIAWLQDQFKVEQIEGQIRYVSLSLQRLNGGETINFKQSKFTEELAIAPADSIWQELKSQDPHITAIVESEAVAMQQIQLQKNKLLPKLTAGFNYQGVQGNNYSGVYGGISIPIWNGKNKINAAKANFQYQQSNTEVLINKRHSNFLNQYNQYDLMLHTYREYVSTLDGLNNEELLLEAYQLEQISFMDYYRELQFYRQAYDKMLEIEKELHLLIGYLLKHQL